VKGQVENSLQKEKELLNIPIPGIHSRGSIDDQLSTSSKYHADPARLIAHVDSLL